MSFGATTIALDRQRPDYPENSRWRMGRGSPEVGWAEITLDPANPATPTVEPRLIRPR